MVGSMRTQTVSGQGGGSCGAEGSISRLSASAWQELWWVGLAPGLSCIREAEAVVERLSQPEPGSAPLAFKTEYAQPLWRQYVIILAKNLVSYWRRVAARGKISLLILYMILSAYGS